MKFCKLLLFIPVAFLFSCGNKPAGNISKYLNPAALPAQIFAVDISSDTLLMTSSGCIIKLPKGTLQSSSNNVKLEIKEALSNTDIVLAGLTTMSGSQPLSSGGMIYINAAEGYKVEIKKAIEILVPSKTYNPDMQVFKGEEKNNGSIDWTEPAALPKDDTQIKIETGERLFKANCASCHKIDTDFTGPSLAGVTYRRPKQWLYDFTRNSAAMVSGQKIIQSINNTLSGNDLPLVDSSREVFVEDFDFYSICLYNKWNKLAMTSFANMSDADLDALYAYIKTEGDKYYNPQTSALLGKDCCDSCDTYGKALLRANLLYKNLPQKEESFFTLDQTFDIPTIAIPNVETIQSLPQPEKPYTKISPTSVRATYYTINIKTFGWYNIDIAWKNYSTSPPSELFVRLQGTYKTDLNVVLIIPSEKIFVEGGKLADGKQYGFDENDGRIPLPPNATCYVMAFGEYNNKLIFGKTAFTSQQKQTITIALAETSKEKMTIQIKELNLDEVKLDINKKIITQIPDKTKDFDSKMQEAMKLKPKGCDCGLNEMK